MLVKWSSASNGKMANTNPQIDHRRAGLLPAMLLFGLGTVAAQAQWVLEEDVLGAGGDTSTSSDYMLSDTLGQLATESPAASSFQLAEGFWNVLTAVGANSSPTAQPDTVLRVPGESAKYSVFELLANDTEDLGHPVQLVSVSPTSALGGTVRLVWPWIYYFPPIGSDAPDSFTYTASDSFGGSSTATVSILIGYPPPPPAPNAIGIDTLPNGHRLIRFAGVPGLTYHIEASSDLMAWTRLGEAAASALGEFRWDDADAALFPVRFYRSTWP